MRRRTVLGLATPAVLALAACSAPAVGAGYASAADAGNGAAQANPPAYTASTSVTIAAGTSSLGPILVDGEGRTLYLFEADTGPTSTCNGGCATSWPPVLASGPAVAGAGVIGTNLGMSQRADGSRMVTYAGHPLYRYVGDAKPGDISGQRLDQFGAEWYVLNLDGQKVEG